MPKKVDAQQDAFDATLTPAEKAAPTFLDWSDATLGRATRETARLIKDFRGNHALGVQGAIVILAATMYKANAETLNITTDGNTGGAEWVLTVKAKLVKKKAGKR